MTPGGSASKFDSMRWPLHEQSRLRRLAASVRRCQNDNRHARSSTHHRDIIETGNGSWRFMKRALPPARYRRSSRPVTLGYVGSAPPVSAPSEAKHSWTDAGSSLQAKGGRRWKRFHILSMWPNFPSSRSVL
jgi:hypothetical protein